LKKQRSITEFLTNPNEHKVDRKLWKMILSGMLATRPGGCHVSYLRFALIAFGGLVDCTLSSAMHCTGHWRMVECACLVRNVALAVMARLVGSGT
jgi:hypothetical protein